VKYDRELGWQTLIELSNNAHDWNDETMPTSRYFGNEICFVTKLKYTPQKCGRRCYWGCML